jgi:DNA-binding CsgD family transcriptional regulator
MLVGSFAITPTVEIYYGIDRARGERPFNRRERDLLLLILKHLGWFHRRLALSLGLIEARTSLSPRRRELLRLLLTGRSEKQIADDLQLTASTVHQYVTQMYRNFGVHGRVELMALWLNEERAPCRRESD